MGSIKAWLNLGGILQGRPLVDLVQAWPQRWLFALITWYNGWSDSAISSMGTEHGRARFARQRVDPAILVINYLGVPLSEQLSKYSKDKYPLLRSERPNDGLTLLTDAIQPDWATISLPKIPDQRKDGCLHEIDHHLCRKQLGAGLLLTSRCRTAALPWWCIGRSSKSDHRYVAVAARVSSRVQAPPGGHQAFCGVVDFFGRCHASDR